MRYKHIFIQFYIDNFKHKSISNKLVFKNNKKHVLCHNSLKKYGKKYFKTKVYCI